MFNGRSAFLKYDSIAEAFKLCLESRLGSEVMVSQYQKTLGVWQWLGAGSHPGGLCFFNKSSR